ncbi:hypothetical protein SAMN02744778_01634 [Pantoea sp. GL120224-02]|jgi:hypothetical protein|nr:hypothetical protein SAMN02744778_01634 [Pantoea sp. GL120224-02]
MYFKCGFIEKLSHIISHWNVSTLNIRLIYKGDTCHQEEVGPVILLRMRTARVKPGVKEEVQAGETSKIVQIALLKPVARADKSAAGAKRQLRKVN